jgi:hypothetical protein
MMRKLAVTVFAMSLTLVGCGSSSTSKKDAGPDAQTSVDVAPKLDTVATPDTFRPTPDTGVLGDVKPADGSADTLVTTDTAPKADVIGDTSPTPTDTRDGAVADRQPDTFVVVRLDAAGDTKVTADAPADTTPVSADADVDVGGDAETD